MLAQRVQRLVEDFMFLKLNCVCCFQNGGETILSMDTLFGFPRNKSAGVSHRDPLLKDVFFYDQLEVDRFVSENECGKGNQMVSMLFLTCCLYYS